MYKNGGYRETQGYRLTDQAFYIAVNDVFREAKREAWQLVLLNNPALRKSITQRKVQKELGRSGLTRKIDALQNMAY